VSPITNTLSPAGVARPAAPAQGPLDASVRKFAALMDPVDEGPGSLDKTLASTGEGPADGEVEGPQPVPTAFDTSFMFHLRA